MIKKTFLILDILCLKYYVYFIAGFMGDDTEDRSKVHCKRCIEVNWSARASQVEITELAKVQRVKIV